MPPGPPANTFSASLLWLRLAFFCWSGLWRSVTSTLPKPHEPLSNRSAQLCASNIPLGVQVQARIQQEASQRERAQAADELAAEPYASEAGLAGQSSQGTRLAWAA